MQLYFEKKDFTLKFISRIKRYDRQNKNKMQSVNTACVEQSVVNVVKLNTTDDFKPLLERIKDENQADTTRVINQVNVTRDFLKKYTSVDKNQSSQESTIGQDVIRLDGAAALNVIQNAAVVIINYNCCDEKQEDNNKEAPRKNNKMVFFNVAKAVEAKPCEPKSVAEKPTATKIDEKTPIKREMEALKVEQVEIKKKRDEPRPPSVSSDPVPTPKTRKESPPPPPPSTPPPQPPPKDVTRSITVKPYIEVPAPTIRIESQPLEELTRLITYTPSTDVLAPTISIDLQLLEEVTRSITAQPPIAKRVPSFSSIQPPHPSPFVRPPPSPIVVASLYSPSMISLPNAASPNTPLSESNEPIIDLFQVLSRSTTPTSRIISPIKFQNVAKPRYVLTHVRKQIIRRIVQRKVPCC